MSRGVRVTIGKLLKEARIAARYGSQGALADAIGIKRDDDGKEIKFDVKVGDTVLMPKYGGTEIKIDDKTYQIVREEDLLGVIG